MSVDNVIHLKNENMTIWSLEIKFLSEIIRW